MYDRPILAIIRENLDSEGRLPRDFCLPEDPDDESSLKSNVPHILFKIKKKRKEMVPCRLPPPNSN